MSENLKKFLDLQQLKLMHKQHVKELKLLRKMTDKQFKTFKKNFSIGLLDENITRNEAISIISSMLALNLRLQNELKKRERE